VLGGLADAAARPRDITARLSVAVLVRPCTALPRRSEAMLLDAAILVSQAQHFSLLFALTNRVE